MIKTLSYISCIIVLSVLMTVPVYSQNIYTVAGDGTTNGAGSLIGASGVAVDSAGNIYVATGAGNQVRKTTPDGTISVFAGTGTAGFSGDNGPALEATLNLPIDVSIHASKLYIADQLNRRIRMVDLKTNQIVTVAGDGNATGTDQSLGGTSGVAVDEDGNIYVTTGALNTVKVTTTTGITSIFAGTGTAGYSGDGAMATAATLNVPKDICVSNGDLYIADVGNKRIRKVSLSDFSIVTAAGDGSNSYSGTGIGGTAGVGVDDDGNVFVATGSAGNLIRKISSDGLSYTDVTMASTAGGNPGNDVLASTAMLNGPASLYIQDKNLYVADQNNRYIREIKDVAIALPVELSNFGYTVTTVDQLQFYFNLEYTAAISGIFLETSTDGTFFRDLTSIDIQTQKIQYRVNQLISEARSYYRLRIEHIDGSKTYSGILSYINNQLNSQQLIQFYPNPLGAILHIEGNIPDAGTYQVNILNLQGRLVRKQSVALQKGIGQFMVNTAGISSGIYLVQLLNPQGKPLQPVVKIIKR